MWRLFIFVPRYTLCSFLQFLFCLFTFRFCRREVFHIFFKMYFFLPVPCSFSEAAETVVFRSVSLLPFRLSSLARTRIAMNPAGPGLEESSGLPLLLGAPPPGCSLWGSHRQDRVPASLSTPTPAFPPRPPARGAHVILASSLYFWNYVARCPGPVEGQRPETRLRS